jgi:hypothetical protein
LILFVSLIYQRLKVGVEIVTDRVDSNLSYIFF